MMYDRVLTKARKSKVNEDWLLYKKFCNTCNNKIKAAKRSFQRNLLNEYAGDANYHLKDNNNKSMYFVQKCSKYFATANCQQPQEKSNIFY